MKLLSLGIDYITIRFQNPHFSSVRAQEIIFQGIFGASVDDFAYFKKGDVNCYYSKDIGIDIKIGPIDIVIEFHGTFFTLYGFKAFKALKRSIFDSFKSFPRVTELHIAQDFIGITVEEFEKKYRSKNNVIPFRASSNNIRNDNTKKMETLYIKGSKGRWNLTVYDKTEELRKNVNKSSPQKIEAYRKKGYFDNEITRFELKIKSEYCKTFLEDIETENDEVRLCNTILGYWYKNHKVYQPTKTKKYNPKNPGKCPVLPVWKKLFNRIGSKVERSAILKDATFKNLHQTSDEAVVDKLVSYSLKYNQTPAELISRLLENSPEYIELAERVIERKRRTDEYLRSLAS